MKGNEGKKEEDEEEEDKEKEMNLWIKEKNDEIEGLEFEEKIIG